MSTEERKRDTRHKIQLGGLVIKAGLGSDEFAVLLGVLTSARRFLNGQSALEARQRCKEIGDKAFGIDRPP